MAKKQRKKKSKILRSSERIAGGGNYVKVCCSGSKEVVCQVWSTLDQLFLRKLQETKPEARGVVLFVQLPVCSYDARAHMQRGGLVWSMKARKLLSLLLFAGIVDAV